MLEVEETDSRNRPSAVRRLPLAADGDVMSQRVATTTTTNTTREAVPECESIRGTSLGVCVCFLACCSLCSGQQMERIHARQRKWYLGFCLLWWNHQNFVPVQLD